MFFFFFYRGTEKRWQLSSQSGSWNLTKSLFLDSHGNLLLRLIPLGNQLSSRIVGSIKILFVRKESLDRLFETLHYLFDFTWCFSQTSLGVVERPTVERPDWLDRMYSLGPGFRWWVWWRDDLRVILSSLRVSNKKVHGARVGPGTIYFDQPFLRLKSLSHPNTPHLSHLGKSNRKRNV